MKKTKVLIYPCGAENALEVYAAIRHSVHIEICAASSKTDHSKLIYDTEIHKLPNVNEDHFVEEVNKLIEKEQIHFIFPTHDTVALYLAKFRDLIAAKIITSDYATNKICRYKLETFKFFSTEDFIPHVYNDNLNAISHFPIFAKPNVGEGAKGVCKIDSNEELQTILNKNKDLIFVEYLPGKEYTIDCFTDRFGTLKFAGVRERVQIQMGISFHNREVKLSEEFQNIAITINQKLSFRGLWFFQLKEDSKGNLKLLEISTRVAGSMGFFRQKGINLPLLSVFDAMDMNIEINANNFEIEMFRSTINRYDLNINYDNVYIDFDDTLIINNKVNTTLIMFIYQAIANGKKVYLITKHIYDIYETLKKFKICSDIFTEIILLKMEDKKSWSIKPEKAIFIDNWYAERKEVSKLFGIPVFDVDVIDCLIKK